MPVDARLLNMICLLRGKRRVKLHWRKAGAYWSESWDAHHVPDKHEFAPARLGYTLSEVTYEDNFV